jgi:hypothetical protein
MRSAVNLGHIDVQGCLDADPAFVDPACDDLHQRCVTSCIDAGTSTGIALDFEADPRARRGGGAAQLRRSIGTSTPIFTAFSHASS